MLHKGSFIGCVLSMIGKLQARLILEIYVGVTLFESINRKLIWSKRKGIFDTLKMAMSSSRFFLTMRIQSIFMGTTSIKPQRYDEIFLDTRR